jgi:hypothetical protein
LVLSGTRFSLWILILIQGPYFQDLKETPQAEQVAEKFKKCHSEGAVCPRNLLFVLGLAENADPSLRSG